jgi:hypothetical protein
LRAVRTRKDPKKLLLVLLRYSTGFLYNESMMRAHHKVFIRSLPYQGEDTTFPHKGQAKQSVMPGRFAIHFCPSLQNLVLYLEQ